MFESTERLFSLALGLLTLAYTFIALLRGKVHGLRQSQAWTLQIYTPESIFTFPLILSLFLTLSILLTLMGFGQGDLLRSPYLLLSGTPALLARLAAIWLLSYAVVFFLSQIRRLIR